MKILFAIALGFFLATNICAQTVENVIVITIDGVRWQEVFKGMDDEIANQPKFHHGDSLYLFNKYDGKSNLIKRKKLMPFLWSVVSSEGQLYGNRDDKNFVNTANNFWLSYPGYSELFTGFADPGIKSNDFFYNKNKNIFEFINEQENYKNKVAAFASWYALSGVLNKEDATFPIITAFDTLDGSKIAGNQSAINSLFKTTFRRWGNGESPDAYTHYRAFDYLKNVKPKVLYIGYGETDAWAHEGYYKNYLDALHQVDNWLHEIWEYLQSDEFYKNKTAVLITTDHGRGSRSQWTAHEREVRGSGETWMAVIGPGISAKGALKTEMQLYQNQCAQTIAQLLGFNFSPDDKVNKSDLE